MKQRLSFLLLFFSIVVISAFFIFSGFSSDEKGSSLNLNGNGSKTVFLEIEGVKIKAEIAQSPEERKQGLSERENIEQNSGMFFVFENEGHHGIWMKDMNFPIDIIWIDESLNIVHIAESVSPETFPEVFSPPIPARYVLEVNAGLALENKFGVGSKVFFPKD